MGQWGTEKQILLQMMGRQERVPAGGCWFGPGSGVRVSAGGFHIHRSSTTIRVARKPRVVGGGGEGSTGSPSGDDVNVGEYIGDSERSDQQRGRGQTGGEDCGAVASGVPGTEGARWR